MDLIKSMYFFLSSCDPHMKVTELDWPATVNRWLLCNKSRRTLDISNRPCFCRRSFHRCTRLCGTFLCLSPSPWSQAYQTRSKQWQTFQYLSKERSEFLHKRTTFKGQEFRSHLGFRNFVTGQRSFLFWGLYCGGGIILQFDFLIHSFRNLNKTSQSFLYSGEIRVSCLSMLEQILEQ